MSTSSSWSGLRASAVHAYTASGAVLALLIVLAAIEGDVARALWLGLAALVVDGTDGMLARRYDVKERLPSFDGALLDNIVDYLTYVFAPVVLLLQSGYLPEGWRGTVVAAVPLIASSYQFCRTDAKTARPLLPRLPELLERRRLLRGRHGPGARPRSRSWWWSARCSCPCRSATSTRRACTSSAR